MTIFFLSHWEDNRRFGFYVVKQNGIKGGSTRTARRVAGPFLWMLPSAAQRGLNTGRGHTNLQIPVDDPIHVAVVDTLQDLLYAVAEQWTGTGWWEGGKERKRGERRRQGKLIEGGREETMYHMTLSLGLMLLSWRVTLSPVKVRYFPQDLFVWHHIL